MGRSCCQHTGANGVLRGHDAAGVGLEERAGIERGADNAGHVVVDLLELLKSGKITAVLDLAGDAALLAKALGGGSTASDSTLVKRPRLQRTSTLGESTTLPGSKGITGNNVALDLGVVVVLTGVSGNEGGSRNGGNSRKTDHFVG